MKDLKVFDGIILEVLPNAEFKVKLLTDVEHVITAYTAGIMRKNRIRVLVGDKVQVELAPRYDITKGRVIYRY